MINNAFSVDSLPDLTGKLYVVTGGNAGMFVLHCCYPRHGEEFAN
jgi:hypothetical protein